MSMIHGMFQFNFTESPVWLDLHRGYEDETGAYIETYNDEEWAEITKQAEGKNKIRLTMLHEGQQMALESAWFYKADRSQAFQDLMRAAAKHILLLPTPLSTAD